MGNSALRSSGFRCGSSSRSLCVRGGAGRWGHESGLRRTIFRGVAVPNNLRFRAAILIRAIMSCALSKDAHFLSVHFRGTDKLKAEFSVMPGVEDVFVLQLSSDIQQSLSAENRFQVNVRSVKSIVWFTKPARLKPGAFGGLNYESQS